MISTVTTPVSPRSATILLKGEALEAAAQSLPTPAATPPKSATSKRPARQLPTLTRSEIAIKICAGQDLIIRGDLVLNVTSWGEAHPGGDLALLHFVGRDATDEVTAYHSDATLDRMTKFAVGRVVVDDAEGWAPLTPPIQLGLVRHPDGVKGHWKREGNVRAAKDIIDATTSVEVVTITPDMIEPLPVPAIDRKKERARSKAYHELKARVVDAGLFVPPGPLSGYGKDIVRYLALAGSAFGLFFFTTGWVGQILSAALLGFCWQQITCEYRR
jgi:delta8-fatty-acid desaturase